MEIIIETMIPNQFTKCLGCNVCLKNEHKALWISVSDPDDNGDDLPCNVEHEIFLCGSCLESALGDDGLDVLKLIANVL